MLNVTNEIQKAFNGDAWHGNHAMQTLNNVKAEIAFEYFIPNAHSIAEIALHLISWTEEVTSRLMGNVASEPALGDWPIPESKTAQAWEKIIFDFKVANEELIRCCGELKNNQFDNELIDKLNPALEAGISNEELLNGLVQHHAYHCGQIALLSKFE
ncbi:DinB family protein [Pedobacter sp. Leaf250]|uniref:DinB family protein n=1 Tax=Pedobacter sp. Leaf250 TaxID=2876559 RepID=UPI001E46493E|nr:DinB family protein [Pedobacter sp. Leaf250]